MTCLGDGHDGVWNIIAQLALPENRGEILDWYHLNENLQKIGGSIKRLRQAESLLWTGKADETIALFVDSDRKQAKNFCRYLEKHRHRIVNYDYYQAEGICSIGSGAVESAIKQIDRRIQISGAQRNAENVPQVLAQRTAYLNHLISQQSDMLPLREGLLMPFHSSGIMKLPIILFQEKMTLIINLIELILIGLVVPQM